MSEIVEAPGKCWFIQNGKDLPKGTEQLGVGIDQLVTRDGKRELIHWVDKAHKAKLIDGFLAVIEWNSAKVVGILTAPRGWESDPCW